MYLHILPWLLHKKRKKTGSPETYRGVQYILVIRYISASLLKTKERGRGRGEVGFVLSYYTKKILGFDIGLK